MSPFFPLRPGVVVGVERDELVKPPGHPVQPILLQPEEIEVGRQKFRKQRRRQRLRRHLDPVVLEEVQVAVIDRPV